MTEQCNPTSYLNANIDRSLHVALKIKAAQTGKTMRALLEESLRESLDMHDRAQKDTGLAVEKAQ